ncbi:MAG: 3-dehydroquinate synthase II [Kiritimatiellae bacterium]|nr:3-dehydroquinate synthase II [Kiritimatiellia bacterium]
MKQVWVQAIPWDKQLAIAAIESGADAVIVEKGRAESVKDLGRIRIVAEDGDIVPGRDVVVMEIRSKSDENRAAKADPNIMALLKLPDWTIIPIENILAQRGKIMAEVKTADEARTMFGVLEKGVDGVAVVSRDPNEVRKIVGMVHGLSPRIELKTAVVKKITPSGMGDRVCIDTCSAMTVGEGMLVGNASSAFFLVHSESLENPYVAARPFRVNASALHAYILLPENKTAYLSDLRTGDTVLIVEAKGGTRTAQIGRCKIESRPMILITAEADGRQISVYLQNAETINLVRPDGRPVSVAKIKEGDQVLARIEDGGRHFGMKISEKLVEK